MSKKHKLIWLVSLCALLLAMISIGGITRLTKSGLSITQWKPVTGMLPPLSEQDWQRQFELYQQSPEFHKVNSHFELEDYKNIFWWEYLHRLLGRIIFVVAAIMSIVFWRKKEASITYAISLPLLIAFQGLIGWLMVKTGLNHRPSVSHYMLWFHFSLAVGTMVMVYYHIAKMKSSIGKLHAEKSKILLLGLGAIIFLQITYGCFTSGLKAGLYFPTFPMMGGKLLPQSSFDLDPFILNFFENPVMVQWIHRWLGISTALYMVGISYYLLKFENKAFARPLLHLASVVLIQAILGILTLIKLVPTSLAVIHQVMAVLVVLGYFNLIFRIEKATPEKPILPVARS